MRKPKLVRPRAGEKRAALAHGQKKREAHLLSAGTAAGARLVLLAASGIGVGGVDWRGLADEARVRADLVGEDARRKEQDRLVVSRMLAGRDAGERAAVAKAVTPLSGEGPDAQKLARQAVVRPAVHDRLRPRSVVMTGDLPRAVRDMVARGWLSAEAAGALKRYADDLVQAGSSGVGVQSWGERVDGGGGARREGRTVAAIEAGQRARLAGEALGSRLARTVEMVMVHEVALGDLFAESQARNTRSLVVSGMLIGAGDLLIAHFRARGG